MGRIKKFATQSIRKITGGRDPVLVVEDFISRAGYDADEAQTEATPDVVRWLVKLEDERELELLLENIKNPHDTTLYMGVNVFTVPLRDVMNVLVLALTVADGLVGIKASLVGHTIVLSATLGLSDITGEELDYHYKLIAAQESWFRDTLNEELSGRALHDET